MPRSWTDVTGLTITLSTDSADACRMCRCWLVAQKHDLSLWWVQLKPVWLNLTDNVSQAIWDRRRKHTDAGRAACATDLSVIGKQMCCHAMIFTKLDKVEGVQNEQQWPYNGFLWHTAQQTGDEWPESTAMNVLRPIDEIWPKPPMRVAIDAEGLLQQNVMIDGVKGCR